MSVISLPFPPPPRSFPLSLNLEFVVKRRGREGERGQNWTEEEVAGSRRDIAPTNLLLYFSSTICVKKSQLYILSKNCCLNYFCKQNFPYISPRIFYACLISYLMVSHPPSSHFAPPPSPRPRNSLHPTLLPPNSASVSLARRRKRPPIKKEGRYEPSSSQMKLTWKRKENSNNFSA